MIPVALTIAGSDPSGGAGIQADLKTFHQFGVYGEAVLTLLTVQNTLRVSRVEILQPDLVIEQLEALISDIPPKAVKTGALGSAEIVEAVAACARSFDFPLVVDPVMISKSGSVLMEPRAREVLKRRLLPCALLVTPNIPEAELLTGLRIINESDVADAAAEILRLGCQAVLIKGGHSEGEPVDFLFNGKSVTPFRGTRVNSTHTHGTGCTYSAAIAASLALGHELKEAVSLAKGFIQRAIETAPRLGAGCGPVNHFADVAGKR